MGALFEGFVSDTAHIVRLAGIRREVSHANE